jgi:hypothetical protein
VRVIGERRAATIEMLKDIIARLDRAESEPVGCFVQVFAESGEVGRFRNIEPGFNLLQPVGIFESAKADLVDEIRGIE